MRPIEFPEQNTVFAKNQPEYQSLPAFRSEGRSSGITSCWELTDEDLWMINSTRKVFVTQLTFRHPLQPIRLDTTFKPEP